MTRHSPKKISRASIRYFLGLAAFVSSSPLVVLAVQDPGIGSLDRSVNKEVSQTRATHRQTAVDGVVTFDFSVEVLDRLGVWFLPHGHLAPEALLDEDLYDSYAAFEIDPSSTFEVETINGRFSRIAEGSLVTCGAMRVDGLGGTGRAVLGNLTLLADSNGKLTVAYGFDHDDTIRRVFDVTSVAVDDDALPDGLRLVGELAIEESWAREHGLHEAVGVIIGKITVDVETTPPADRIGRQNSCTDVGTVHGAIASAPSPGPNVLIGDLQSVSRYTRIGDITAYAVGTNACNIGTERANWIWYTNQHPMIFEHIYRLDDRGFQQIGMSWLKHGFYAVSQSLCSPCLDPTDGSQLGVGCSDPYTASLNGEQRNMMARSRIDPHTGYFEYTGYDYDYSTQIDRRMQVHDADIDPDQNPDARYFIEGHYITADDAAAGNDDNNASYREVLISNPTQDFYDIVIQTNWTTRRGQAAVRAWKDVDDSVKETDVRIPDEGLFILASKVVDLGDGTWRYLYALQNLNSDRCAQSFTVPLPPEATVEENIGFHDVDYHSGDPYEPTDWTSAVDADSITWYTDTYATNSNANALRYGTVYNFSFDCDVEPANMVVTIGLFKPGTPTEVTAASFAPTPGLIDCNGNGIADACDLCASEDCESPCVPTAADCDGDGVLDECEIEDCSGGADCGDCNGNGVPDGCEAGCETASAEDIDDGQTVELNPSVGSGDPTEDALVVFTNGSGAGGASVTVNETVDPVNPDTGGFVTLDTTLIIDTSLSDGQFLMKVVMPFEPADLSGADPLTVDILWYDSVDDALELAVANNTGNSPGLDHPVGDRYVASGEITPALTELSDELGDFGTFWNTSTLSGFAWANVDHVSDFAAAVQIRKNRYVSMVVPPSIVPGVGRGTAIRVHLTSLHHPDQSPDAPDFGAWEGRYRWVNSLTEDHTCSDSPNYPGSTYRCAVLGCDPEYRDWAAELGGEILHLTGAAVVPSSQYNVALLDESCVGQEGTCASVSDELSIFTATYGDVDPLSDALVVLDIARIVDHVKGMPFSTFKPGVHLRPDVPDALGENVGVLDIATCVDAVKGNAYWHFGDFGPCTDACPGEAVCP